MTNKDNLFFYNKLFESTPYDNQKKLKTKRPIFFFHYAFNKIKISSVVIYSILSCFFLKKNKILFFNHTNRFRKANDYNKYPLYFNNAIFNIDELYVIDDNSEKIKHYEGPRAILNSTKISEFISLLTFPIRIVKRLKFFDHDNKSLMFFYNVYCWTLIFKILQPKKILMVVWYGKPWVISAAKKLSIQVIDLQHGILHQEHRFYNLKNCHDKSVLKNIIPDQCWVYGAYWKNQLIKAGWEEKDLKIFGYYLNVPLGNSNVSFPPYILYTTSCAQNKTDVLAHINSIIDEVKKRKMKIIIAPHPNEDRDDYKEILSDIINLSEKDSYELLKFCYSHISTFSTLLWEGLYFKKPTYILGLDSYVSQIKIFNDLIDNGLAKPIFEAQFPELYTPDSNLKISEYFHTPIDEHLIYN